MKTAYERLQQLLTDRNVKCWETNLDGYGSETLLYWESPVFGNVHAMQDEYEDKVFMICLNNCSFTPEDAVNITLGPETCYIDEEGRCSECSREMSLTQDGEEYTKYCGNCGRKVVPRPNVK